MTRKWNQGAINADALLDAIAGNWMSPMHAAPVYNTPKGESQAHYDLRTKRAAKRKNAKAARKRNRK